MTGTAYREDMCEDSLEFLLKDYTNKKNHYFRVSQAYKPDQATVQRALDAYMLSADKYRERLVK